MREHDIPYPVDKRFPIGTPFLAWGPAWGSHFSEKMEWIKAQRCKRCGDPVYKDRPTPCTYGKHEGEGQHDGIDLLTPDGTDVVFPLDCQVVAAGFNEKLGKHVRIAPKKSFINYEGLPCQAVLTFAHLEMIADGLLVGAYYPAGTFFGKTGHTGNVRSSRPGGTGAHLHMSMKDPIGRPMRIKLV